MCRYMVSHTKVFVCFDGYSLDSGADPEFLVRGGGGPSPLDKNAANVFFPCKSASTYFTEGPFIYSEGN